MFSYSENCLLLKRNEILRHYYCTCLAKKSAISDGLILWHNTFGLPRASIIDMKGISNIFILKFISLHYGSINQLSPIVKIKAYQSEVTFSFLILMGSLATNELLCDLVEVSLFSCVTFADTLYRSVIAVPS